MKAGISLAQALSAAEAVHGLIFDPKLSLKALSFFEDGDLQRLPVSIQNYLAQEARRINLGELPPMKPWTGEMKS
ncbi:MAG TPA: hypothetical protein VJA94_17890 [Candidatus Angelobacter sp.]